MLKYCFGKSYTSLYSCVCMTVGIGNAMAQSSGGSLPIEWILNGKSIFDLDKNANGPFNSYETQHCLSEIFKNEE